MSNPRIHADCGGIVLWDVSGGWCTKCHAEGLEPDETGTDDAERDRPGEAGRSLFGSLHENRST